jgi:ribose 5-phosphate isomerase B
MNLGDLKDKLIILAADHNGVELKKHLHEYLTKNGFMCIDLGPFAGQNAVDYTDYAHQLGSIVHSGDCRRGILICGTGVGMSIAVNRFENVRGALIRNTESASKCREHNDSNVLCLGSWLTPPRRAEEIVSSWLGTDFGGGRHVKRVEKISLHKPNTVVFANGVFDILHTGHIELIKFAKSLGDRLVVAINSDRTVVALKGESRPINNEADRKKILESIQEIDEVIIFDDTTPTAIINKIHPDIVVKGGEWTAEQVKERDNVPEGIDVKIYPLVSDRSTTNILKKIHSMDEPHKNEFNS